MPINPVNLASASGGIVAEFAGIKRDVENLKGSQKTTSFASGGNQILGETVTFSLRIGTGWRNIFRIEFLPSEINTFAKFGATIPLSTPRELTYANFPEIRSDGKFSWIFGVANNGISGDIDGSFIPIIFATSSGIVKTARLM